MLGNNMLCGVVGLNLTFLSDAAFLLLPLPSKLQFVFAEQALSTVIILQASVTFATS